MTVSTRGTRALAWDNYILDFFCHELMLGIELDGYSHTIEEVYEKDRTKESKLLEMGIDILRFDDREVYDVIENVLAAIEGYIDSFEETLPCFREASAKQSLAPANWRGNKRASIRTWYKNLIGIVSL